MNVEFTSKGTFSFVIVIYLEILADIVINTRDEWRQIFKKTVLFLFVCSLDKKL